MVQLCHRFLLPAFDSRTPLSYLSLHSAHMWYLYEAEGEEHSPVNNTRAAANDVDDVNKAILFASLPPRSHTFTRGLKN